jgi:hypothetical protein
LKIKALPGTEPRYEQSYPQIAWILHKSFANQGLKQLFSVSHQQSAPMQAFRDAGSTAL